MEEPRPEKVAVVEEVRERLNGSDGAVVTEYRGMTVTEIQSLRQALKAQGSDYKVFKNTLVRRAVADTSNDVITDLLVGPTGIAFISGDVSAAAKTLRDFAKATPTFIIKGGVVDGSALSASDFAALAELPSREVLLSQIAGVIAAPMRQFAALLKAVPQNFAYGLSALLETKPAAPAASEPAAEAAEEPAAEAPSSEESPADDAPAEITAEAPEQEPVAEAVTEEAAAPEEPAADSSDTE